MPFRHNMTRLLNDLRAEEHRKAQLAVDEAAKDSVRHAIELRDERTARIALSEGRQRLNGWSS